MTDAHHVWNGGLSKKCSDAATIPLCRYCHTEHHGKAEPSRKWCVAKLRMFWRQVGVHPSIRNVSAQKRREIEQAEWERAACLMLDKVGRDTYVIADYLRDYWR